MLTLGYSKADGVFDGVFAVAATSDLEAML